MKKLALLIAIILASYVGFGQATPASHIRVASNTTDFGINIPIGTTVYDIGADKYYVCKTAALITDDLTSAAAKFTEMSMGAAHAAVTLGTANGLSLSGQQLSLGVASAGVTGALSGTDWSTFNSKLSAEVDGSISNEGSLTVAAGAANTSLIHSNTSGSTDITVSGGTGISVTESGSTITIATTGLKTAIAEDFEQAADSITNNRCYFQLSQTPSAGTISVQLNGMNLKPTTQYLIVGNKLRVGCAVYKYDQVSIAYSY